MELFCIRLHVIYCNIIRKESFRFERLWINKKKNSIKILHTFSQYVGTFFEVAMANTIVMRILIIYFLCICSEKQYYFFPII